jgi:hypothetical protein
MKKLGRIEIDLKFSEHLFVLAYPHDFVRPPPPAEALTALIMIGFVPTIIEILPKDILDDTLYCLFFGLSNWGVHGFPGVYTAFTRTWDFENIDQMVILGHQYVNEALELKKKVMGC